MGDGVNGDDGLGGGFDFGWVDILFEGLHGWLLRGVVVVVVFGCGVGVLVVELAPKEIRGENGVWPQDKCRF